MIPPSRALGGLSGDQRARAEVLGDLLIAAGEKPLILTHDLGRKSYFLILVFIDDDLASEASLISKTIKLGSRSFLALPLEADLKPGDIPPALRSTAGGWSTTITVQSFRVPQEAQS